MRTRSSRKRVWTWTSARSFADGRKLHARIVQDIGHRDRVGFGVQHHFHQIRIQGVTTAAERRAGRRHIILRKRFQTRNQRIYCLRLDFRFVTLHVNDDLILEITGHFGDAVGATGVSRGGHHAGGAEGL